MKHLRIAVVTGKQSRHESQQCVNVICCFKKIILELCEGGNKVVYDKPHMQRKHSKIHNRWKIWEIFACCSRHKDQEKNMTSLNLDKNAIKQCPVMASSWGMGVTKCWSAHWVHVLLHINGLDIWSDLTWEGFFTVQTKEKPFSKLRQLCGSFTVLSQCSNWLLGQGDVIPLAKW